MPRGHWADGAVLARGVPASLSRDVEGGWKGRRWTVVGAVDMLLTMKSGDEGLGTSSGFVSISLLSVSAAFWESEPMERISSTWVPDSFSICP